MRYSAWGQTRYSSGTTPTATQFTGQVNDGYTGLYYYNARYYDPTLHRFIQADTIVPDPSDPQTLNRYAYVNNNPIKNVDPTGHYADEEGGIGCDPNDTQAMCVDDIDVLNPPDMENLQFLVVGGQIVIAVACEACDWGMTFYAWSQGDFHPIDLVGLAPFIPASAVRPLRHADGLGAVLDGAANAYRQGGDDISFQNIGCPIGHSFDGETLVTTKEGQVPISEIEVGDEVLAYHEETKAFTFYPVTVVWEHTDPEIVYLTLDGETIFTTPSHPFLTVEREWVEAKDLTLETEIYRADGTSGEVESLKVVLSPRTMFDLTVDEAHTYTVGEEMWVVHNCGVDPNKLNHIFGKPTHNLDEYLQSFKGNQAEAMTAIQEEFSRVAGMYSEQELRTGISLNVNGFQMTVRGNVLENGVVRVGTAFIPGE